MKWYRIWAVAWRYLIQFPQDINQWTSMFFWPLLDIALFGFVGVWMHDSSTQSDFHTLLAGVALWQFLIRINFDISLSLLEETWAHNTVNLFASPLSVYEWLGGVILKGSILGGVTFITNIAFVWFVYGYNMFTMGSFLAYTTLQLFISGLVLGMFGSAMVFYWGPRVQAIVFTLGFITSPISGAFYPVSVLPEWIRHCAYTIPFSHIFEGLYLFLQDNTWPIHHVVYACVLNGVYASAALATFVYAHRAAKRYGLERLAE